jgi:hypothetical protein
MQVFPQGLPVVQTLQHPGVAAVLAPLIEACQSWAGWTCAFAAPQEKMKAKARRSRNMIWFLPQLRGGALCDGRDALGMGLPLAQAERLRKASQQAMKPRRC